MHAAELERRGAERITRGALIVAVVIHALIAFEVRHEPWLVVFIAFEALAVGVVNVALTRLTRGEDGERSRHFRMAFNVACFLFVGHLTHWCAPNWAWLPFFALLASGPAARTLPRLAIAVVVMCCAGLLDGVSWTQPARSLTIAAMCFLIVSTRTAISREALRDLASKNERLDAALKELKQLHDGAVSREKLASLGLLSAGIAHEINNPMSFVTANLGALLEELRDVESLPAPLVEYRDEVLPETIEGVRRVNRIVADLQKFARGDAEVLSEFNVNRELEAACRMARSRFGDGRRLEIALGEVPLVHGRPGQIAQVAMNLLVNAAQAIPAGGTVRLTSRADGDGVSFAIADDGVGMDEAVKRQLFQPFFTTKPVGQGTGLGLAVSHGIVTSHGGAIAVESAPGKGTTFTVNLPRRAPETAARHTPLAAMPAVNPREALEARAAFRPMGVGFAVALK